MRLCKVKVRRSEVDEHETLVPPWEVPILEMIHGDVAVVEDEVQDDRPDPTPAGEFERLSRRYGATAENNDEPFVAMVYGSGHLGIRRLGEAMAEPGIPGKTRTVDEVLQEDPQAQAVRAAGQDFHEQQSRAREAAAVAGMASPDPEADNVAGSGADAVEPEDEDAAEQFGAQIGQ